MQLLSECASAGNGTNVGRNNHHVFALLAELLGIVIHKDGVACQVIHRDIEEALDLVCVQVHGQDTVSTCSGDHVGNQLCRDGIASLCLTILTSIAEVGDHGSDAACGCTAQSIDHDQQLHQVVVDGVAGGLDHEHVAAADSLVQGDGNFAVSESLDFRLAQLGTHQLADLLCQSGVGIAAEYLDVLAMRNHCKRPLSVFSIFFFCCFSTKLSPYPGLSCRGRTFRG